MYSLASTTESTEFTVVDPTTGIPTNADSTPTATLRRNESASGVTVTVTNLATGRYRASWTNGAWTAGDRLTLEVSATVSSDTYTETIWEAKIDVTASSRLAPTTAGRTIDVDANGYVERVVLCDTTTTNSDMRGTDSAFLAANAPANFGDLAITATTGKVTVGTNDDKTGYALSTAGVTAVQSGLATAAAVQTAQDDLDILTGIDGVILATTQPNYAPAKAGDQMDLVDGPNGTAVGVIQSGLATSTEVTSIQNNTRVVRVVPSVIERPDSGTQTYRIELLLYDAVGNMEAPDSAPILDLVNQSGTDLSSRLDSAVGTLVSTGRYRWIYTATNTDTLEQLIWTFAVTENAAERLYGNNSVIVDTTAVDFTSADRTKLEAIHGKLPSRSYLAGSTNSSGALVEADLTNLDQSLSQTEANIRGVDSDTLKTVSDQLDAKASETNATLNKDEILTAVSGIGGDATASNQSTIITHLTDIKGTGFAKDTHSLTDITEDVTGLNGAAMRGTDGANTTAPDNATIATISSNVSILLARIPSGIFTGMTSLAQWLGLIAAKHTGNSTARTELNATGDGSGTFDETADSLEASQAEHDATQSAVAGISGGEGSGARTFTIHVQNGSGAALENAKVRMILGAENYLATTDANGDVSVSRDDGTWSVAITLFGHTFTQTNLTVSAATEGTTQTYSMTAVDLEASEAGKTTGYLWTYVAGVKTAGVTLKCISIESPGVSGVGHSSAVRTTVSDGTGLAQFTNLIKGAEYQFILEDGVARDFDNNGNVRTRYVSKTVKVPPSAGDEWQIPMVVGG